jgi:SAM-dependent methyltransferase
VSQQQFTLVDCGGCGFRFTNPAPSAEEIGPYYLSDDYISHSNTRKGLVSRVYQWVRRRAIRQKANQLERETGLRSGAILDVGCGTGEFLAEMKRRGWSTLGLEPSPAARTQAQQNHQLDVRPPTELFALGPQSFDVITLWHVLEHVHTLNEYVAQLHALLKPNGLLVVAVPNATSHDAQHYGPHWAAWDVPRHLYHFSKDSMTRLMARHGFAVATAELMPWDAYYVALLSEKYRTGRTRYWAAFWAGWRSNRAARQDVTLSSSLRYGIRKA